MAADYDLLRRCIAAHPRCAWSWSDQVLMAFKSGGLSGLRALEVALEEELMRQRVWQSPPNVAIRLQALMVRVQRRERAAIVVGNGATGPGFSTAMARSPAVQ